jgi:predicted flap endonuclease-1-like 5' DNA nuclease
VAAKGDELESREAELAALRVRLGELEAALSAKEAEAESAVEQIEALKTQVDGTADLTAEIERLERALAERKARGTPGRGTSAGTDETGPARRRDRGEESDAPRLALGHTGAEDEPSSPIPTEAPRDDESATRRAAGTQELAERVARDPNVQSDDLRTIPGIGVLTVRILHSLNIRTFRQLASLTPEDIETVAAALNSTPERITRNDWIREARRQHLKKYGETI